MHRRKKKKTRETVNLMLGTSLTVQWLRLCTSNAGGVGLIPGQETKLSHASRVGWQKKEMLTVVMSGGGIMSK